jgi:hypothetical protein
MVSRPALTIAGMRGPRGTTIVSGPGHSAAASRAADSGQAPAKASAALALAT